MKYNGTTKVHIRSTDKFLIYTSRSQKEKAMCSYSTLTEFVLEGLTHHSELQLPLFLFLGIYGVTMLGNLGMILLIAFNSKLQSPIYFFLGNLSFLDLFYSSVVTSKLLGNFVWEKNVISYPGCMTQLFFFCGFAIGECFMLSAMANDRYVAICNPLLYNVTMSPKVCNALVIGVYTISTFGALAHTVAMTRVSFCGDNVIQHYFCDIYPLLKLSCSSTHVNVLLVILVGGFNLLTTTSTIFIFYAFIIVSILRICSAEGRSKSFGTCGSHLTAIEVFYGSLIFMYFKPSDSTSSMAQENVASVFYTTMIPILNPLIYNKDVKNVLKNVMGEKIRNHMDGVGNIECPESCMISHFYPLSYIPLNFFCF
ncbi:LOW QUALITY PROTEIN: olfactory receptor 151-like [Suncus etruscus]|uniref:LOW QUALITY PROTEIN: olfactory receptor 151-like n=1 Tax=Suncus etruscus TaxID=109475 RepID=UPI00210FFFDE|nr:LOW QUALITY PROTEIN: olfactory receptor 151-like [Suncus etruscus]